MTRSAPSRSIALVRISDDRTGTAVGVGRQEQDCRELADRLHWTIEQMIVENDTSAYRTRTVRDENGRARRVTLRPGFEQVLDALDSGRADGLIVYDIDRLARQPYDLERLIDIVTVRRTPVVAVTGSVDLSTSGGIAMARVLVAMASKSSDDTSRRVRRALRQSAEMGKPHGGVRPYGYRRTTLPDGSPALEVDQGEAVVITEVARRILLGDTLNGIAVDLTRRGVPTVTGRGKAWSNSGLRGAVSKPTVAGLRPSRPDDDTSLLIPAAWPAILDRETWEHVRAVLSVPKYRRRNPTTAGHLLSGIATCALCLKPMHFTYAGGARRYPVYKCSGCQRASKAQPALDEYVTDVVLELLHRPEVAAARDRFATAAPGRALVELEAYRDRRRQMLEAFALDLTVNVTDRNAMLRVIDERIAALEAETVDAGHLALPEAAGFADLPLSRRRAVVAELVRVAVTPGVKTEGRRATVKVTPAY